ncbi:hypothetical protein OsJ_32773 [Oryza sativa Japonica Group]|uniref:Uncharacterized protein n=4 Tax=Oryza TaxID=4527 RepID=A0A8J8XDN5_ORYSJ|nr:hypothetical protein LOC_Os11g03150 [Oryza sativa Japonica Group]EAZ17252.1 hypothetical protein OsJ_32773 [Oryza sativa Japonica Group]
MKVKVKERLTREEVERLLSFVPRPFPPRDRPRCDDPDVNEMEDLLAHTVLLLNSNNQVILRAQARAREELRTKGYVERWTSIASSARVHQFTKSIPIPNKATPSEEEELKGREEDRCVAMTNELKRCSKEATPSEEKAAKKMKKEEAVKKKRMPMERVHHLLSMVPRAPVPLPVIRDDSPELKEIDQRRAGSQHQLSTHPPDAGQRP